MEPALKQRLIGAAVLVALAVIFLPMLIKGPAPESGISDVPLEPPAEPADGGFETRELPLLEPGTTPEGGALGMPAARAADAEAAAAEAAAGQATATEAGADSPADPAAAGGDWAVTFGSYASAQDAQRVVEALARSQLRGYHEPYTGANGRELHRVRIGPFASRADADAARVRAAAIRSDVRIEVVALDAPAAASAAPATAVAPPATGAPRIETAQAAAPAPQAPKPEPAKPEPAKPAEYERAAAAPATPARPAASAPAASDLGFAVQVGAFSDPAEAERMRTRLRAAGFTVFTETVRTERGTLNRVRVGPVATRAEADQLKAQVVAKAGVDGIVRPHP